MMEGLNGTEIAVHDAGARIASFNYVNNTFTIGRDMGWNAISSVNINGNLGVGISSPSSKLTIKSTYNNEDSGLCLDASDGNVYHLNLYSYVITTGQVGYKFRVGNQA